MSKQAIIDLINESEIEQAIAAMQKAMPGNNDIILQASRWNGLKKDIDKGLISSEFAMMSRNRIKSALLNMVEKLPDDVKIDVGGGGNGGGGQTGGPKVFISYNHKDKEHAHRVKAFFEEKNIPVLIDVEEMNAGEDIQSFINRCIKASSVTLSLVSTNSLLSGWVGMESILTLTGEGIADKQFIACSLESDFFDMGFMRKAIGTINEKIAKIDEEMKWRRENGVGIEDIQNEMTRNNELKSKLPSIIATLKNRLTIDISGDNFEAGMQRVFETVSK
ncbi:MAG TPA: toll/interleukin-1 receptor domain-containing protein [Bacteroidetes bacterium]|nr:toll/interleukin-1 receptor domain-containing protein [Bacteroidota bacterium]